MGDGQSMAIMNASPSPVCLRSPMEGNRNSSVGILAFCLVSSLNSNLAPTPEAGQPDPDRDPLSMTGKTQQHQHQQQQQQQQQQDEQEEAEKRKTHSHIRHRRTRKKVRKGGAAPSPGWDISAEQGRSPILPGLDDESASLCIAFTPRSNYRSLSLVGSRLHELIRSGSIYGIRRQLGIVEQWVYLFTNGDSTWKAFDPKQQRWMQLPPCGTDYAFIMSDKESLSAGTHLLWLGKELFSYIIFRYDLITNNWDRCPSMNKPRCLFASASCGEHAYVAGGNCDSLVLKSAEKYNSERCKWECLPDMHIARQKASGCYLDGKFYVIGGRNSKHERILSGEEYDPSSKTWREIENMSPSPEGREVGESSPPLVAVVKNSLFCIDSSINVLKIYNKGSNSWKQLGPIPVRADFHNGWGLAFKALGDELYVIGGYNHAGGGEGMAMFSWKPTDLQNGEPPVWRLVTFMNVQTGNFLYNCAVMAC